MSNFYVLVSDAPFGNRSLDELLADASVDNSFHQGLSEASLDIPLSNVTGRYVRVQLLNQGILSLAEVEVFGQELVDQPSSLLGSSEGNAATSCKAILESNVTAENGLYWLSRNGGSSAFEAYCDMTTDGGGWTMVVAQYETDRTNDWNEGIQSDYDPSLLTKKGFVLNSSEIPVHTQVGFGRDLMPTDIDYVNFQYTTGNIALTGLTGIKTSGLYYIHRNLNDSYGAQNAGPQGTLIPIQQWRNTLTFDIEPGTHTWAFSPNNLATRNNLSGYAYNGVLLQQSNETFAWTVWVR